MEGKKHNIDVSRYVRKFPKEERSTFSYWFNHWLSFNITAYNLGYWKFKWLFHDLEKPFLRLWYSDYLKVRKWHRAHRNHHIEYGLTHGFDKIDYNQAIIDWECSRWTKINQPYNARENLEKVLGRMELDGRYTDENIEYVKNRCEGALHFLGL